MVHLLFRMSSAEIAVASVAGLEYTLPDNKLHYALPDNKLHFTIDEEDS